MHRVIGGLVLCFAAHAAAAGEPQQAFDLNESGVKAAARGDYTEAERLYTEALTKWRAAGPEYRAHAATTMFNLSQVFCSEGRWREGRPLLEQALGLYRQTLGLRNNRTLETLNVLGSVDMVMGEFDRSAAAFLEALPVERGFFPNDLQLVRTLGGLSSLRMREGKLDEALAEGEEALALSVKNLGEDNTETATLYANVAGIHRRAGHAERALPLIRKAHAIYDKTIEPDNPLYASMLTLEGLTLMDSGQARAAEKEMVHAVNLLSGCASECGFPLAMAENNLGLLRLEQKRYSEADRLLSSAIAREQQYSTTPSGDMIQTMTLLAQVREKEQRFTDAADLRRRIASLQASTFR